MSQYKEFAEIYAEGEYTGHSAQMVKLVPELLDRYDVDPDKVLDLACGEGTFARGIAENGCRVKGIDLSEELIHIARERSENQDVEFEVGDMRDFSEQGYDLVTCWYDSLNYLKSISELESAFENVRRALADEGYFIFDMNTYHWLSKGWPSDSCYIAHEDENMFEVHRTDFDEKSEIFTLEITAFQKDSEKWTKFEEEHQERAYRLEDIKNVLKQSEFEIKDIFGDIENKKPLSDEDPRVWIVAKKS